MRHAVTICTVLFLSLCVIFGLTNFKKKLANVIDPPQKKVVMDKKDRTRAVFNYQMLDPEIWQIDHELEQASSSRSSHYITEFFFKPLLHGSTQVLSFAGELQLSSDIEGYTVDDQFAVDHLPQDSYFQITIRTDHDRSLLFRCSGFHLLPSGIFLNHEGSLEQLSSFGEAPHPMPTTHVLPISVEFGDESFTFSVHDHTCSTARLKNEQILSLSIRSGQWPIILDHVTISTIETLADQPPERKEYLTEYRSFQNPMSPVSLAAQRGKSDTSARMQKLYPETIAFLPLVIALLIMLIAICVIRLPPGWSIILSLIAVVPLTLPTMHLIQTPSLVFHIDALFGILLAGLVTCAAFPRHSGLCDSAGIPFDSTPHEERRLFLCAVLVVSFALVLWSIVQRTASITAMWSLLSVVLFLCVCTSFFLLKKFFQPNSGFITLVVMVILLFSFEYWFAKSPSELLSPVNPPANPSQLTQVFPRGESRLSTTRVSRDPSVLRILCTGGSSTYGFPYMNAGIAYPAQLETAIKAQRAQARIEVLNGGILGYTSFLIRKSLETDLLAYRPDIIIVYSRFNDSLFEPRWFTAFPVLTDQQAWEKYEKLARIPRLYAMQVSLNNRFFYRLLKTILFSTQLSPATRDTLPDRRPPRGTVEEFRGNLEKIATLAREHHARLIMVPEANQYSGTLDEAMAANPYVQAMVTLAGELDVPLIDVMSPMSRRRSDDLFVDYIHPSQAGHRLIAETIVHELLALEWM